MKKIIKFIFLIIGYLSFLIGIANAQGFWVKFIDDNNDGKVTFSLYAASNENQDYYTGIAPYNNTNNRTELLKIPANSNVVKSFTISPGIYDVYLTPNYTTFYWTSRGDAVGSSTGATLTIDWFSGSGISVFEFVFSLSGDTFQLTAVPLPSALWLFGSGLIALGLIYKKLLSC